MKIEIKNAPSKLVDWSKNMQIVKSINGSTIVLTTTKSMITGQKIISPDQFSRIDISNMSYSDHWMKSGFEPFNGELTLKND
jgi:hypothetical protein